MNYVSLYYTGKYLFILTKLIVEIVSDRIPKNSINAFNCYNNQYIIVYIYTYLSWLYIPYIYIYIYYTEIYTFVIYINIIRKYYKFIIYKY